MKTSSQYRFGVKEKQDTGKGDEYTNLLSKKGVKANMYCYLLVHVWNIWKDIKMEQQCSFVGGGRGTVEWELGRWCKGLERKIIFLVNTHTCTYTHVYTHTHKYMCIYINM